MLIDTNIFIELLMIGANFEKVFEFFTRIPMKLMVVTDFTVHSVGILLNRFGKIEYYTKFINDLVVGGISVVSLDMDTLAEVPEVIGRYNLDFDDAYQYVAAEKYDLTIISYDSDFNRTLRGRKTPEEILKEL